MKKHIEYTTKGTCSKQILLDIEEGVVTGCRFVGGCHGNTQGVSILVTGMRVEDVVARLEGIRCGFRDTSCPDQLAQALKIAMEDKEDEEQ